MKRATSTVSASPPICSCTLTGVIVFEATTICRSAGEKPSKVTVTRLLTHRNRRKDRFAFQVGDPGLGPGTRDRFDRHLRGGQR